MDRYAIFVDAGYVYAAGGTLVLDTSNRSQVRLDHERFIARLRTIVEQDFPNSGQFLRVYWYDAAPRGLAQPEHEGIARLAGHRGVPRSRVQLVGGATARLKRFRIDGPAQATPR